MSALKALIIGFGSIGRRHHEILCGLIGSQNVEVVSRRETGLSSAYRSMDDISDLNFYDYFIVASKTSEHFRDIEYINSRTEGKIILSEKPLFETHRSLGTVRNKIYVGYNLRFHPAVADCLELLASCGKIFSARFYVGQYLPGWRTGTDYRDSYSAKKEEGGGITLDCSHDIDLVQFFFGRITDFAAFNDKISDLEITSDDYLMMIGRTDKGVLFSLSMDYISKKPSRVIDIHAEHKTVCIDLVNGTISSTGKDGKTENRDFTDLQRNTTYKSMHEAVISGRKNNCASYEDGVELASLFDKIRKNNLKQDWK